MRDSQGKQIQYKYRNLEKFVVTEIGKHTDGLFTNVSKN